MRIIGLLSQTIPHRANRAILIGLLFIALATFGTFKAAHATNQIQAKKDTTRVQGKKSNSKTSMKETNTKIATTDSVGKTDEKVADNDNKQSHQIHWKDVKAGMEEGKAANKYVLADVYTDWCVWCKRLDKDTFTNESLIQLLNSKFVCVKANAEDNGAGQKLAGEYGVNGFPVALVFDQKGKLIGRVSGYKDAQNYEAALTSILSNPSNDQ